MAAPSTPDPLEEPSLTAFWQKHGTKILLVLTAAALVFAAVRYRRNQEANKVAEVQAALSRAWSGVQQAESMMYSPMPASMEQVSARQALENDVNQAVQTVQDEADSSADVIKLASASLARGELYWALAHAPAATSAQPTTQLAAAPSTQPVKDYLGLAKTAYAKVVSDYPGQTESATLARFGLAAVAEDQRDIADARTQYQAILADPAVSAPDKSIASERLKALNDLEKPLLLLPATQPAAPATAPAVSLKTDFPMMNMGAPSTQPATKP